MRLSTQGSRVHSIGRLARPFTMIAPILGTLAAAIVAIQSQLISFSNVSQPFLSILLLNVGIVVTLNTASNGINQIFDIEIDRINKPERPLPAGQLTIQEAWIVTLAGYVFAIFFASLINATVFLIVILATLATIIYSVPPFRTKRSWFWANLTIAVTRGAMLILMGWASFAPVQNREPWFIGFVISCFIFGAAATKDFSDMEGDRQNGCITLPIQFGIKKSVYFMLPFFTLPFTLIGLGSYLKILSGNPDILYFLSLALILWGAYTIGLILREPAKITSENHPSWRHMYTMMFTIYLGFIAAYLFNF